MSIQELLLGAACLLVVANAARRGFLREGSLLLGLAMALWSAGRLFGPVVATVPIALSARPWVLLVYAALVGALLLLAAALSALVVPLARGGPLRFVDRAGGLLVGLAEATLVVGLAATIGERVGVLQLSTGSPAAHAVRLAGLWIGWLSATIPPEIALLAPRP